MNSRQRRTHRRQYARRLRAAKIALIHTYWQSGLLAPEAAQALLAGHRAWVSASNGRVYHPRLGESVSIFDLSSLLASTIDRLTPLFDLSRFFCSFS